MVSRTLALVIMLGIATSQARGDLITNGSFEAATVNPGSGFVTLGEASTSITGWLVGPGNIDYLGTSWQASEGGRSIDLNGVGAGGIAQTFATQAGRLISVFFDMAGNPDGGPAGRAMTVSAGGVSQQNSFVEAGFTRSNMGWMTMKFQFIATTATTTLQFTSTTPGNYGPALDNVRATGAVVPEPSSIIMLGSGALGLLGFVRSRRGRSMVCGRADPSCFGTHPLRTGSAD